MWGFSIPNLRACHALKKGKTLSVTSAHLLQNRYFLDGPGIESLWGRDFLHLSRHDLRLTQPPNQCVPGLFRG
jgi:hypothetical protein